MFQSRLEYFSKPLCTLHRFILPFPIHKLEENSGQNELLPEFMFAELNYLHITAQGYFPVILSLNFLTKSLFWVYSTFKYWVTYLLEILRF